MPTNRRAFLSSSLATPLAGAYAAAAQSAVPSRIERIETVYWKSRDDAPFWPHWTWVKIDTDNGVSGIGETYPRNAAEAAVVNAAFHGRWNLTSAIRIARALEPYRPMWLEHMLMPGNYHQYVELASATSLPLIAGERMAGKLQFEALLQSRAVKYVMFDLPGAEDLTEARKIAAMADAFELPNCASHCWWTTPFLRYNPSLDRHSERLDPGEAPAVLRTRRACHAGKPDRAGTRLPTRTPKRPASACALNRKLGTIPPPSGRRRESAESNRRRSRFDGSSIAPLKSPI